MTKQNIYEQVTNKIIAELKDGRLPWVQPWQAKGTPLHIPANASTSNSYSGINILLLWASALDQDYTDGQWLTYKQAQSLGGHVRKGEKGTTVVFASTFKPKDEQASNDDGEARFVPFLKRYTVFNVTQCEGLKNSVTAPITPKTPRETHQLAEDTIAQTGADFRIGGDSAFYSPNEDFIRIPHQQHYHNQIDYYRTAFHELGHWTMHKDRCDRNRRQYDGLKGRAFEELIAELTAAFVCAKLNIAPTVRHADYIGSWLECMQGDTRFIFKAASQASKAADFILKRDRDH